MPKSFYTDRDIEDLVKQGVRSLRIVNGETFLTEMAYERAERLGLKLIFDLPEPQRSFIVTPEEAGESQSAPSADSPYRKSESGRNILSFGLDASERELRDAIVETGRLAYQSGLMVANDGNISAMMNDGNILITPSGVCKGRISPDDLLIIDAQGKLVKSAADPFLKPTSEQPMHLEVYRRRKDVRAVIHSHLIFANALAITKGKIRMDVIPEAAVAFGSVPVTDFAMPSTSQNADAIRSLIGDHDVILIRNHGALTVGKNLDEALINLERLEHVSKTLVYAQLLGDMNTLPTEILDAIARINEQARAAR